MNKLLCLQSQTRPLPPKMKPPKCDRIKFMVWFESTKKLFWKYYYNWKKNDRVILFTSKSCKIYWKFQLWTPLSPRKSQHMSKFNGPSWILLKKPVWNFYQNLWKWQSNFVYKRIIHNSSKIWSHSLFCEHCKWSTIKIHHIISW